MVNHWFYYSLELLLFHCCCCCFCWRFMFIFCNILLHYTRTHVHVMCVSVSDVNLNQYKYSIYYIHPGVCTSSWVYAVRNALFIFYYPYSWLYCMQRRHTVSFGFWRVQYSWATRDGALSNAFCAPLLLWAYTTCVGVYQTPFMRINARTYTFISLQFIVLLCLTCAFRCIPFPLRPVMPVIYYICCCS